MSKNNTDSDERTKSNLSFLHESRQTSIKNGKKVVHEEIIIDGPKGVTIKYFHNEDGQKEKINIIGRNGSFSVREIKNDQVTDNTMNIEDLKDFIKKNDKLKFVRDFAKTMTGGNLLFRARKGSKRGTKKGSKRGSKKGSKRGSKL
jgi:hypothetical protein